jgi:4-carboxymuconolactone decarboxylase
MPETRPRIPPLEPPYEPELERMLEKWMPPNSELEPLALFRTLGRHADLFSRALPLGAGILGHGLVEPRLREVMIHRTCALTGAEYEWGVHVSSFGRPLGFTDEQLASTVRGSAGDPVWSQAERAVLGLADELHETSQVSDELFAELERHFDAPQIIELCLTSGCTTRSRTSSPRRASRPSRGRSALPRYQRSVTIPTSPSSFQRRSSTFAGMRVRWG